MNNAAFNSENSPPFGATAPAFFYSNLRIQETLTTLRYGIEARKGVIVITGETGIGKTTLLHKLVKDVAVNVTCIVEPNPRIAFPDVLRLLLRNFDSHVEGDDESSMLRSCKLHLRKRLERCQIVTLFIDDAQQMSDRTLRHLIQNFLGGSVEDPDGPLLQLVLAGRPELRTKLSQAALIPLRRCKPMMCTLHPLTSAEVASYVEHGLISNQRPADLFDPRAVKRIALYSKGNPRAINALGAAALQLASPGGPVTAELVDQAAGELKVTGADDPGEAATVHGFEGGEESDHAAEFQFPSGNFDPAAPIFPSYPETNLRHGWLPHGEHMTSWVRRLSILIVLVGGAAMIRTDTALTLLGRWTQTLKASAIALVPERPEAKETAENRPGKMPEPDALLPLPGPDRPTLDQQDEPLARAPAPVEPSPPSAPNIEAPSEPNTNNDVSRDAAKPPIVPRENRPRRPALKEDAKPQSQDLQIQVAKAIENRAIMGVEVSVVRGIAYLDGHVATERQRRAAERAARSVAGVERVRNRIAITFG